MAETHQSSDTVVKVETETLTRKAKVNFNIEETSQTEQEQETTEPVSPQSKIPIIVVADDEEKPNNSSLRPHIDDNPRRMLHSKSVKDNMKRRKVEVFFEFHNIGKIDTMHEKFQAEVLIKSKWEISPDNEVNEDIFNNYDANKHWNPRLYIENAVAVRQDINYEASEEDGHYFVTESRNVKGNFWTNMQLKHFPVDVQELEIILTSSLGSEVLELVHSSSKISYILLDATKNFRDHQQWRLFRLVTTDVDKSSEANKKRRILKRRKKESDNIIQIVKARQNFKPPRMIAKVYASRKPNFYLCNAFFLVWLITTMCFANWSVSYDLPHFRLQTTYVILLNLVSFKWVVNRSLPPVYYLTSLDAYHISSIFFVVMLATWHGLIGAPYNIPREDDYALNVDYWLLGTFGVIYILLQTSFIFWVYHAHGKIRKLNKLEDEYFEKNKSYFLYQSRSESGSHNPLHNLKKHLSIWTSSSNL